MASPTAVLWARTLILAPTLVLMFSFSAAQEPVCCSMAPGSCRVACEKVSLVDIATDIEVREERLSQLRNFCCSELIPFWKCVNATLEEVSRGEGWSGRSCCPLPQSEACRVACVAAGSPNDLVSACRKSDEIAFFSCLDRQEVGEKCCANAQTPDCARACRSVFRTSAGRAARDAVTETCTNRSPKVLHCVKNYTRLTPATNPERNLHCCNEASKPECREACRTVLRTQTTQESVVEGLEAGGCGPPLPIDKLWQCFLQSAESGSNGVNGHNSGDTSSSSGYSSAASRIDRVGMDSAKLQCCSRAASPSCKRLCTVTYSNEWAKGWDIFHQECLLSISEVNLAHCIDEVDKPCELGCEGLNYCTNFNNRPTELFRSCDPKSDDAARSLVAQWEDTGRLSLPLGLGIPRIPLRNTSSLIHSPISSSTSSRSQFTLSCSPITWKAVACTLQLNPCHPISHDSRICMEDCLELVTQCTDWSKMPSGHHLTPASICARLSPPSLQLSRCISLWPFLSPSSRPYFESITKSPASISPLHHQQQHKQLQNDEQQWLIHMTDRVTAPCKVNPCGFSEVCIVNRNCFSGKPCIPYICIPGCRLGEVSTYVVPRGSFIQIPVSLITKERGCYKVCECSSSSELNYSGGVGDSITDGGMYAAVGQCQPMPCFPLDPCWLGSRKIEHGSWFYVDCNLCSCYSGEKTCSKRQCGEMWGMVESYGINREGFFEGRDLRKDSAFIPLPCNCPAHYVPVCGRNGRTYPSSCLAKCAGLGDSDFEFGACTSNDPCKDNACSEDEECIPSRRVCLSLLHRPCPQYECVKKQITCSEMGYDPVCDTDAQEHPNSCYLVQYGKKLSYRGNCIQNCKTEGEVCGINGDTYPSECAAIADHVTVDYLGPCNSVGKITEGLSEYMRTNHWEKVCWNAVKCPSLPRLGCLASIPPGACCPVCAGALRLLFSQKQVEHSLYVISELDQKAKDNIMTVQSILSHLERHIQVAECSVYGMLSIEMDLYVLVKARDRLVNGDDIVHPPSELQMEACAAEAEKLARMIQGGNPRLFSELPLSTLTTAKVVTLVANSSSDLNPRYFGTVFVCFFVNYLIHLHLKI